MRILDAGAFSCCDGCLYNIQDDPTEHADLRLSMPTLYAKLRSRLLELGKTAFQTSYIQPGIKCLTPEQAKVFYRGFRGPPCFNESDVPVVPTPPPAPPPPPDDAFQLESPGGRWCLTGPKKLGLEVCDVVPQWRVGDPDTGELASATAADS